MWENIAIKSGKVLALRREACLNNYNPHFQLMKANVLKAAKNRQEAIRLTDNLI
jgi:hypothetical protein